MINDVPIFIIWIENGGRIKNMWMILDFLGFFLDFFYECSWRLYKEVGGRKWRNEKKLSVHDSIEHTIDLNDPIVLSLKKRSKG